MTYGDGVATSISAPRSSSTGTMARKATRHRGAAAASRYGALELDGDTVSALHRKAGRRGRLDQRRLLRPRSPIGDVIDGDRRCVWEREPLERLAARRPAGGLSSTTASGSRWTRCATRNARRAVERQARRRGSLGLNRAASGGASASSSPGHTGFKGSWLLLWLQQPRRRGHRLRARARPSPSLFDQAGVAERCMHIVIGDMRDAAALRGDRAGGAAGDHPPSGRAAAGARSPIADPRRDLSRPTSWAPRTCSKPRAAPTACAPSSSSPPTNATTTTDVGRPIARATRSAGTIPIQHQQGLRRDRHRNASRDSFFGGTRHRRRHARARATSSAAAIMPRDRLIPDVVRALSAGREPELRNPAAVRPWQHVLEPLSGYLLLAEKLAGDAKAFAKGWNFGPSSEDVASVADGRRSVREALGPVGRFQLAGRGPSARSGASDAGFRHGDPRARLGAAPVARAARSTGPPNGIARNSLAAMPPGCVSTRSAAISPPTRCRPRPDGRAHPRHRRRRFRRRGGRARPPWPQAMTSSRWSATTCRGSRRFDRISCSGSIFGRAAVGALLASATRDRHPFRLGGRRRRACAAATSSSTIFERPLRLPTRRSPPECASLSASARKPNMAARPADRRDRPSAADDALRGGEAGGLSPGRAALPRGGHGLSPGCGCSPSTAQATTRTG